jgi:hypothetical protein
MKNKRYILLVGLLLLSFLVKAQVFTEGKAMLSVGGGIGNVEQAMIKSAYDSLPNPYFSSVGPFFLKYEEPFSDKVSFALQIAYVSAQGGYLNKDSVVSANPLIYEGEDMSWYSYSILARLNWHFLKSTVFDTYLGIGVGYRDASCSLGKKSISAMPVMCPPLLTHLGFEMTFGMRYMVTPNFGFYSEIGLAKAFVQLGVSFRFPAILSSH